MVVVIEEEGVEFHDLPEGCIENVLSFTTPHDVARLSLVSSTFKSAAESDSVWDKFLTSDYHSIISQSDAEIDNNSLSVLPKKDLYLTQKPLLIDDGEKVIYYLFVSGSNLMKVSGLAISSLSVELVYTDVSFLLPLIAKICLGVYVNVIFLS
jgi:hypothetical protein